MRKRAWWSGIGGLLRCGHRRAAGLLVLDDVVPAAERTGERARGLQLVSIGSIVGTEGRARDFDRWFRPRRSVDRQRWERLACAARAGQVTAPIEVYRVGSSHFVRDGHHRVSVARALGASTIDAYVTEILTRSSPGPGLAACSGRRATQRTSARGVAPRALRHVLHRGVACPVGKPSAHRAVITWTVSPAR
jgi:hypothetical protein